MRPYAIQFTFESDISLAEAEMSLHLAMFAVEGLIGRVRVRLDAIYQINDSRHAIIVDAGRAAGRLIVRVFTALLLREFGEDPFTVERINQFSVPQTMET